MGFFKKLFGGRDDRGEAQGAAKASPLGKVRVVGDLSNSDQQTIIELLTLQQAVMDELGERGASAQAVVTGFESMDVALNEDGMLAWLSVTVRPTDAPTFAAKFPAALSYERLANYQPGQFVWVRYDERDPSRVALDFVKQRGTFSHGNP